MAFQPIFNRCICLHDWGNSIVTDVTVGAGLLFSKLCRKLTDVAKIKNFGFDMFPTEFLMHKYLQILSMFIYATEITVWGSVTDLTQNGHVEFFIEKLKIIKNGQFRKKDFRVQISLNNRESCYYLLLINFWATKS